MYSRVTMYLSGMGDKVELYVNISSDNSPMSYESRPVSYTRHNIHPVLKAAEHANSYEAILTLLSNIKNDPECQEYVKLYHLHNHHYTGHHFFSGSAHKDSIDEMIKFVQQRQADGANLPPFQKPFQLCRIM